VLTVSTREMTLTVDFVGPPFTFVTVTVFTF
jgi:hypothetical protein